MLIARVVVETLPGHARTVVIRGPQHNGRGTIAGSIAGALGRGVIEVRGGWRADDDRWSLVSALATFGTTHGHYSEGQEWHRRALGSAPAEPTLLRARALWGYAHISCWGMDTTCGYGVAGA